MKNFKILIAYLLIFIAFLSCKEDTKQSLKARSQVEIFSEKIKNDPLNDELHYQRALAYSSENKIDEAINDLEIAIKINDEKVEYYSKISDMIILKGNYENALKYLQDAENKFSNNTDILLRLAKIKLIAKQYSETGNYLNKLEKIDKGIADIYFIKSFIYLENTDTAKAIYNLKISTEKNPQYSEAYDQLGLLYYLQNKPIAEDYFKLAIKFSPRNIQMRYNLAYFYQKSSNFTKAINEYEKILKIDKNHRNAMFNIAYINLQYLEKYDRAIEYFDKILAKNSKDLHSQYYKAFSFEKMGKYKEAKENYQKCFKIENNYSLAIEALNRL